MSKIKTRRVKSRPTRLALCIAAVFSVFFIVGLSSCNVTRKVITSSEYYQKGDTSVVIQTKTVESYDASKRL